MMRLMWKLKIRVNWTTFSESHECSKTKKWNKYQIGDPVIFVSIALHFIKNKIIKKKQQTKLDILSTSSIAFKPIENFTIFILDMIRSCSTVTFLNGH